MGWELEASKQLSLCIEQKVLKHIEITTVCMIGLMLS